MIKIIAQQEFRTYFREKRFQVAALILSVLFLFSLYGAYDYYASLKQQHSDAAKTARAQWDNQEAKNPHSAAHYGSFVFKPAYPLSYFDRGVDAFTGNTLFLEAHRMNESQYRPATDRSELARIGSLTPAYVLGILFPLFVIVLGFSSIAKDWESGNLKLLQAQGISPRDLFFGKTLGLWAATAVLALPFLMIGSFGLFSNQIQGDDWARYGLIAVSYLLYIGCFIHLTLIISVLSKRQNIALVVALGSWILICLIIPKATVNIAKSFYPTPSWQAYQEGIKADLENGVDGHDPADAYTKKLEEETLKKYGVSKVDSLPFNWDGFIMQKGEEHETFVFQKHKDQLLSIYNQQQKIHQYAAFLSPFLLINAASQQLAGTDIANYHSFLAAAEKYRIKLVGELNDDLTYNFKYGDWEGKRDKSFFEKNSQFQYSRPALKTSMPSIYPAIFLLVAWFLASGALAYLFFKKLKPI